MDCEEPIQYKNPSYEDNQAKWQEGRGQMARYLSDVHDSVNSYGYQRNVYGAVAVGKLVEFWKYDYLLQNLTKRHVLSGSPISSLQYGPKCPELAGFANYTEHGARESDGFLCYEWSMWCIPSCT